MKCAKKEKGKRKGSKKTPIPVIYQRFLNGIYVRSLRVLSGSQTVQQSVPRVKILLPPNLKKSEIV